MTATTAPFVMRCRGKTDAQGLGGSIAGELRLGRVVELRLDNRRAFIPAEQAARKAREIVQAWGFDLTWSWAGPGSMLIEARGRQIVDAETAGHPAAIGVAGTPERAGSEPARPGAHPGGES